MKVDFFSSQSQPLRGITHFLNPILCRVFLISYELNHPIELTCLSYSPSFAQKKKNPAPSTQSIIRSPNTAKALHP